MNKPDYYLPFYDNPSEQPSGDIMLEEFMTFCEKRLAFLKELDLS